MRAQPALHAVSCLLLWGSSSRTPSSRGVRRRALRCRAGGGGRGIRALAALAATPGSTPRTLSGESSRRPRAALRTPRRWAHPLIPRRLRTQRREARRGALAAVVVAAPTCPERARSCEQSRQHGAGLAARRLRARQLRRPRSRRARRSASRTRCNGHVPLLRGNHPAARESSISRRDTAALLFPARRRCSTARTRETGAAGAEAVLSRLIERRAIGLVTTHDLALSQIQTRSRREREERAFRGSPRGRSPEVRLRVPAGRHDQEQRPGADARGRARRGPPATSQGPPACSAGVADPVDWPRQVVDTRQGSVRHDEEDVHGTSPRLPDPGAIPGRTARTRDAVAGERHLHQPGNRAACCGSRPMLGDEDLVRNAAGNIVPV